MLPTNTAPGSLADPDVVAGLLGRIALVDDASSEDMANTAMGRTMSRSGDG